MTIHFESGATPLTWLSRHESTGATAEEALAFYDALPSVRVDEILGRWRGSGLHTGHPMDGLLESFGWYGKDFLHENAAHPLLFQTPSGRVVSVDSRPIPLDAMAKVTARDGWLMKSLFAAARPFLLTKKARARLRMVEFRGKVSAAMIYDYQPVIDAFRRVDDKTLFAIMDLPALPKPFFFVLRKDERPPAPGGY